MWNTATRTITATLTDPSSQGVTSVAFSPNGQTLAVGSQVAAALWDIATKTVTAILGGPQVSVTSVAFSPDGKFLASGDNSGRTGLFTGAG